MFKTLKIFIIAIALFSLLPTVAFSSSTRMDLVDYITKSTKVSKDVRVFIFLIRENENKEWVNYKIAIDESDLTVTSIFIDGRKTPFADSGLKLKRRNGFWTLTFPGGERLYYNIERKWWVVEPKGNMILRR